MTPGKTGSYPSAGSGRGTPGGKGFGRVACLVALLLLALTARADWPMLHGNARHDGFVSAEIKPPFRLAWVRRFAGERLGTAMEAIVADGRLFVATHSGNVYALDAESGVWRWGFSAHGPFLHSPAFADGWVVAGSTDGNLYALDAATGKLKWSHYAAYGGVAASPVVGDGRVFIGTRSGDFLAVDSKSGRLLWRQQLKAPIRQTAAIAEGRVFVTAEDLRARCFDAADGRLLWTSDQFAGQTARDYYPIIVKVAGRTFVIVRTNPVINMAQRIARDRHLLAQNAGVDDRDWKKVDAWTKSERARGNAALWEREQKAVSDYLDEHREARSFFVLDAATGKEAFIAPVLWIAGCQGVGVMPALTGDGRLLVYYRSAYGNWTHGVAPLVALGLLDLAKNRIAPLFHQYGGQPAWNTFWGTADESQSFVVAGNTVLIVHQGTLSGFDLKASKLFPIWGERDTFGGFATPWWWNEWHGPGRGGVAVVGNRIYWLTGGRVLCLVAGESGKAAEDVAIERQVLNQIAPEPRRLSANDIREQLQKSVSQLLSQRWAPLFVEPGLAGREFFFDDSGEVFEALAWAYPHLSDGLKERVKAFLAEEWAAHPPFSKDARYPLKEGARREWFRVPDEVLTRLGQDKPHHPFGNLYAVWLYSERCGEIDRVRSAWPNLKSCFDDFKRTGWRLDGAKGDLHANRYLASLLALEQMPGWTGASATARAAQEKARETKDALAEWWRRTTNFTALATRFKGSKELDPFIGNGDALSFRIAPHRHKVALLNDLTPELLQSIDEKAPGQTLLFWRLFSAKHDTWYCAGEERQVHYGENFVDPPDLALNAFKFIAWSQPGADPDALARCIDLPFCRADLSYITKLALVLERPK